MQPNRTWWAGVGPVIATAITALATTGCGSGSPGSVGASVRSSPQPMPTVPVVAQSAGAIADARFGHCAVAPGPQQVSGTVRNSTGAPTDLVVTVSWTDATYDVLARGVAVLRSVPARTSRDVIVAATVPAGVTSCTFNVVRGAVR